MTVDIHTSNFSQNICEWLYKHSYIELYGGLEDIDKKLHARKISIVESFVDALLQDDEVPFLFCFDSHKTMKFSISSLAGTYFEKMPSMLQAVSLLSDQFDYNEHLKAFIDCCRSLNLVSQPINSPWFFYLAAPATLLEPTAIVFNRLVLCLRERCRSKLVRDKVNSQRYEAKQRYQEYCDYVDSLLGYRGRIVVIRLDLGFKAKGESMNADYAFSCLDRFKRNWRGNRLFKGMIGHIIKAEYGVDKGIHFHVILFFDGAIKDGRKDSFLCQKIGTYWSTKITLNQGGYWNSNAHADEFRQLGICGIGEIHYSDQKCLKNLKHIVIAYLCKIDQFFKPNFGKTHRLIRRGEFKRAAQGKARGRPREYDQRQKSAAFSFG